MLGLDTTTDEHIFKVVQVAKTNALQFAMMLMFMLTMLIVIMFYIEVSFVLSQQGRGAPWEKLCFQERK